jgi:hypothetical protein
MLRNMLLQQYWNPKHPMVFMKKRCDNAALCNRKVNKEKRRCPVVLPFGAPDNQHNRVPEPRTMRKLEAVIRQSR